MARLLVRNGQRPFFVGDLQVNQDIEVENDETHWIGHDAFMRLCTNPQSMRQGFRLSFPSALTVGAVRTESVGKDETISIHAGQTESAQFQNLLRPGVTISTLEFAQSTGHSLGFRATGVTVHQTGIEPGGTRWAAMTPSGIIAILIGL